MIRVIYSKFSETITLIFRERENEVEVLVYDQGKLRGPSGAPTTI